MLAAWFWAVRQVRAGHRIGAVLGIAVGAAIGLAAWMAWLGPMLLSG